MGKDLGFLFGLVPDWLQKTGIVANIYWNRKHINIFVIIEGQRGERTQLVPERLQRTEYSRRLQKI